MVSRTDKVVEYFEEKILLEHNSFLLKGYMRQTPDCKGIHGIVNVYCNMGHVPTIDLAELIFCHT